MTERKDGFWWVRDLEGPNGHLDALETAEWSVVEILEGKVFWPGSIEDHYRVDDPMYEWGLYLGKSPDEMLGLLLGKDELRRRRLAKAVDPKGDCLR